LIRAGLDPFALCGLSVSCGLVSGGQILVIVLDFRAGLGCCAARLKLNPGRPWLLQF